MIIDLRMNLYSLTKYLSVLGLEADQSIEYGTRHCQDMAQVIHRLVTDGIVASDCKVD